MGRGGSSSTINVELLDDSKVYAMKEKVLATGKYPSYETEYVGSCSGPPSMNAGEVSLTLAITQTCH